MIISYEKITKVCDEGRRLIPQVTHYYSTSFPSLQWELGETMRTGNFIDLMKIHYEIIWNCLFILHLLNQLYLVEILFANKNIFKPYFTAYYLTVIIIEQHLDNALACDCGLSFRVVAGTISWDQP